MLSHYFTKTKPNFKAILWLTVAFLGLRLLSFSIKDSEILQSIFVLANILLLAYLFFKNQSLALGYLIAEFLLDGVGIFFQSYGLSLRTILSLEFLLLYFVFVEKIFSKQFYQENKKILIALSLSFLFLAFSFYLGLKNHHQIVFIFQDLLFFIYFLFLFPLKKYLQLEKNVSYLFNLFLSFIFASAFWSIFNLFLFSKEIAILHGAYYNWLRDFAAAKITYLDFGFWRIVFPEQILLVASILFLSWLYLKTKDKIYLLFLLFANIILALNISRAYFLALIICFVFLKYQNKLKDWFLLGAFILISFLAVFFIINLSISNGKNLGLNILGLRLPGVENIKADESANARLELLPEITKQIKNSPLIGQGLGLNISFINKANLQVNTRHFDWGYLEVLAKFGVLGFLFYYYFWLKLAKNLFVNKKQSINFVLLASLVSILLANIWAQTTLHILSVIFFVFILAFSQNSKAKTL